MVKKFILNPLTHGVFLLIFIIILTNNPFSSFTVDDNVKYYKPIKTDDIVFTQKGKKSEIYYDIKNDTHIYI